MHTIKGLIGKLFPDSPKGSDSEQPESSFTTSIEITPAKLKTQTPISQRLRTRTKQLTHESEARAASTPSKRQRHTSTTARNHVHPSTTQKGRKRGSKESMDEHSEELNPRIKNSPEENHYITTKKGSNRRRSYDEDGSLDLSESSDDFERNNFIASTDDYLTDDNISGKGRRKKSSSQSLKTRASPSKSHVGSKAEAMNSSDENNEATINRKPRQSTDRVETTSSAEADSDDEAPEAVSMAQGKKKAVSVARAEKAAATRLKLAEKSKRRARDQKLKEQSKSSGMMTEKGLNAPPTPTINTAKTIQLPITETQAKEDTAPSLLPALPTFLPQDLLADIAKLYKEEKKKRRHLHTEDFETLEREEKQDKVTKKRKIEEGTKKVGSFDIVALEKIDPVTTFIPENIKTFQERHFFGSKHIPRKNAILNFSQKRRGAAVQFRRNGMEGKNFPKKPWAVLKTERRN